MPSRVEFQPANIAATMKRGETQTQKVTLALLGLEGGDYHLEPGPKPTYNERWAAPEPAGLRLGRNNKTEEIAVKLQVPDDAKFGTHHLRVVAQNDDEPVDQTAVDIAITVPIAESRNVVVPLLILLLVIIVVVVVVLALTGKLAPAQEFSALLSAVSLV